MPSVASSAGVSTILIAGASRGLGLGLAAAFLTRGWRVVGTVRGSERVVGTVRGSERTGLHELAEANAGRVAVESLDIDDPASIVSLRERLSGQRLDALFVNAGTAPREQDVYVGAVSTAEFNRVMLTNALGPMRVIEALQDLVPEDGLIGAMSSGQGSIDNNVQGRREVYRASKAALNMSMRSFAARQGERPRAMLLLAPGWIRTDLGGDDAPYTLEESLPLLADVILAKRERPGLEYLDRSGKAVPW